LDKDRQELIKKLQEMYPDKRISCSEARKTAEELGIELSAMGQLCDEAGLKVFGCELGCF
jgi:hypothetical protein